MNEKLAFIYKQLIDNVEGCCVTRDDGTMWMSVYLDNACPNDMSHHAFAGYLSQLTALGLYKRIHGTAFGDVKLTQ